MREAASPHTVPAVSPGQGPQQQCIMVSGDLLSDSGFGCRREAASGLAGIQLRVETSAASTASWVCNISWCAQNCWLR